METPSLTVCALELANFETKAISKNSKKKKCQTGVKNQSQDENSGNVKARSSLNQTKPNTILVLYNYGKNKVCAIWVPVA